ncbi:hypothetical protein ACFQYP_35660 [Nonomuraea antimicrobica]
MGAGFGHRRLKYAVVPGVELPLPLALPRNHAAAANGAAAAGDGVNQAKLIDETEATNWASLTGAPAGKSVVVDLAGDQPVKVGRVQVSAMLRPSVGDPADPGGQNRFSSLRSFEVLACSANCADPAAFKKIYTSPSNAFDATLPRPRGADMLVKSFDVRDTNATHLMLRTLTTQCTGNPCSPVSRTTTRTRRPTAPRPARSATRSGRPSSRRSPADPPIPSDRPSLSREGRPAFRRRAGARALRDSSTPRRDVLDARATACEPAECAFPTRSPRRRH